MFQSQYFPMHQNHEDRSHWEVLLSFSRLFDWPQKNTDAPVLMSNTKPAKVIIKGVLRNSPWLQFTQTANNAVLHCGHDVSQCRSCQSRFCRHSPHLCAHPGSKHCQGTAALADSRDLLLLFVPKMSTSPPNKCCMQIQLSHFYVRF